MEQNEHFDITNILSSGIPLPELYSVLTSEGIHQTEFKTGVLLYIFTHKYLNHHCIRCLTEKLACIRVAGGCTVHDEGDAILAEWVEENVPLNDAIFKVVECAFTILNLCKIQRSEYHSNRPIKIAISAGRFSRVRMKDEEREVSVITGPAVDQLQSAEVQAKYDDIILSSEAWELCHSANFTVKPMDNGAVKVPQIRLHQNESVEALSHVNTDGLIEGYPRGAYLLTNVERGNILQKFMTQTALDKIHENGQWQSLQEIWPVTVMFMNVQFRQTQADPSKSRPKVNKIIADMMSRCRGHICDFFYFEEGCIFLCAVGLSGDKRQNKTAHALRAAYWIHEMCHREVDCLLSISVGVTTGRVLYNLKQSPLEKYELYGKMLHSAAKLTMDYPGTVSCDMATTLYSMLPLSHIMSRRIIILHEEMIYPDEVEQMFDEEATSRVPSSMAYGRRLALAHMQTMMQNEEMVVQYACAIGHTFSVEMLRDILPRMCEKNFIISLKSLVSVGIIKCASKPRNVSSTETCDSENSRECPESSTDPVWPCRLMSFCNKDEMETVHKLMQKNKSLFQSVHMKCAEYLENKAYRCSKCHTKTFIFEHKAATDNSNEHLQEIYKTIWPYEIFQSQGTPWRNEMYSAEGSGRETESFLDKVRSLLTEERDRRTTGSCECAQLVETALIPRIKHWMCTGDMPKTFYYLLESAAACVYLQNDDRAFEYLSEARSILENPKDGRPPFSFTETMQICEHQQAVMYRLTGEILFKAGKIVEAEECFKKGLKLLNCSLPESNVAQALKRKHEKMRKYFYRSRQFEIPDKPKLDCLQECIVCLSFLWQINCMRGQLRSASLAITMEINLAIRSADPFKILYSAIDYLKYSQLKGKESKCRPLEAFLCRTCASLPDHPEGKRLISHLTRTLAIVKLCTGDLEQSIECTMQAQQLSEVLNRPGLDVRATATLHLPLLLTDRYREIVQQILPLERLSNEMWSSIPKGWFYAACMNFMLYAGFVLRPFEECLAFVEFPLDANLYTDKSLMLHLYSAVALWYARLADWEKSAVFFDKAYEVYAQIPSESISGVVMLLESSVLLFRKELTEFNPQRRSTLQRTQKLLSDIRQQFGTNHIFAPRVLLLNAYMHNLTGGETLVDDLLEEALLLCEKQGNLLDWTWIRQSQADWSGACSSTPAEWSTAVQSMPIWDQATVLQPEQLLKYRVHLRKMGQPPLSVTCH